MLNPPSSPNTFSLTYSTIFHTALAVFSLVTTFLNFSNITISSLRLHIFMQTNLGHDPNQHLQNTPKGNLAVLPM